MDLTELRYFTGFPFATMAVMEKDQKFFQKVSHAGVFKVILELSIYARVIGLENSCHPLNQSDAKLKTKRDFVSRVFPRFM